MSTTKQPSDPDPRDLADLSALADGTLSPGRRAEVEERIAASPELTSLLARERRVVEVLHTARAEVRAPAALRARIEAQRAPRSVPARRRFGFAGGLVGALAALGVALAVILPAGAAAPSVSQAAALAVLGPSAPPPPADAQRPVRLSTNVQDVYFPNWGERLGWRAVGARTDTINGRRAVTVFYSWHGRRIAYTIVAAPALKVPTAPVSRLNGTELRTLQLNGRLVVTWQRSGHTCILSGGSSLSPSELRHLAAWKSPGLSD